MFEIGPTLRQARERRGIDVLEAERATKIRAKYLRALEDERFDILPSQTYVTGFLRFYAEFLGLDGRLFVDEYISRFWVDEEHGRRARRVRVRERRHRRAERRMVMLALVGIAALTAVVIAAWNFGGSGEPAVSTPPSLPGQRPAAGRTAHLAVRAVGGASLLEVRRGGPSGPVLYTGTLERGQVQRFVERRLWLHVSAPENLEVMLNGRPADLGRRCPQVVVVTGRQVTSTASCR